MDRLNESGIGVAAAHSKISASEIRDALVHIQGSSSFAGSERLRQLLSYIIDSFLAGEIGGLKETVIGSAVFGRPTGYDPKLDSIVRTEVRRLRAHLRVYYQSEGAEDPLIIDLPKGAYVPEFSRRTPPAPVPAVALERSAERTGPFSGRRLIWSSAAVAAMIAVISLLLSARSSDSYSATSASNLPRVAVLPFQGPPNDPETELAGLAMTNSVVERLAKLKNLSVVFPLTAGWSDSRRPSEGDAAEELQADYLVTGGFAKEGSQSTLWTRVTEIKGRSVLLARRFDFPWAELSQVEDEMGDAILKGVSDALESSRMPPGTEPESFESHEAYLRGYYSAVRFRQTFLSEDFRFAEHQLQRALELNPSNVDALARLSWVKLSGAYPWGEESPRYLAESESLAKTALIQEPRHVIALSALAEAALYRQKPRVALDHAMRAVDIEPRNSEALIVMGEAYDAAGLFESAAEVYRRCLLTDPVIMDAYLFGAMPLVRLGEYEQAISRVRSFATVDPSGTHVPGVEGYVLIRQGEFSAAEAKLQAVRDRVMGRFAGDPKFARRSSYLDYTLALAQLRQGRPELGREVVRKYDPVGPRHLDDNILLTAGLGMAQVAIVSIEASHFYRNYRYLISEPWLAPLYKEPGFRKLLDQTYQEWSGILADYGDSLPVQPPALPTPSQFLAEPASPSS